MAGRPLAATLVAGLLSIPLPADAQADYQQLRSLGAGGSVGTNTFPPVMVASNGLLYGTTRAGGTGNRGVVYRIGSDGGGYIDLKQFASDLEGIDPVGGMTDGQDGFLYGTALGGGSQGRGTLFRLAYDGGGFTVLFNLITNRAGAGVPDPGSSFAQLLDGDDGFLYGVGSVGGSANRGGVFRAAKDGSSFTTLHSFLVGQGRTPTAALFPGQDDKLYGVTEAGGASDSGTIFRLNRDGTGFETLRAFAGGNDGALPSSSLLRLADGALLGTTFNGGQNSLGLLYRFQPAGPTYTVLRHFGAVGDGRRPSGGLVETADGFVLGVTRFGGTAPAGQQLGTVFKIRPDGAGYELLRSFSGAGGDGSTPVARLAPGADHRFFGTTSVGGSANAGTLFSLVVPTVPVIMAQPLSRTNVTGMDATLAVTAVGPGVLSYRWQFEEQDIENETAADLTVANVQLSDAGDYRVIVTNSYGAVTSVVAVLTVVLPNNPPVVANPIPDGTGTYGSPYSFTFAANTFSDPDAGQVFSYTASGAPPGIAFNGATRTFNGSPSGVGAYQVTVTATDNGLPPLQVSDTFALVIGKAALTAQADSLARAYGAPNPPLTVTYTGLLFGQTPAVLNARPVATTAADATSPVGTYSITLTGGTDDQYQLGLAGGMLTVVRRPLSVIAHPARRPFGQPNPVLTGSLSGVAAQDSISVSFVTTATAGSPAGEYSITPVLNDPGGRLANYLVTTNVALLTVESPSIAPPGDIALTVLRTDQSVELSWPDTAAGFRLEHRSALAPDAFWNLVTLPPVLAGGAYRLALDLEDDEDYFRLRYEPGIEPPPGTGYEAPAPATGVATSLADSTSFLYTGPDAVQTGMAPGTIERRRAAVLRGRVVSRGGSPMSGVLVTVLNQPQYGSTSSRVDGRFDLAVNGGGPLTITYEKVGFLPAQRQVQVPWLDFALVEDVILVPLDPQVTTVAFTGNAPAQIARGSAQTDADGTRRATMLFAPATTATLVMPNGATQPAGALNVRATEFTVGPNGPAAMPGALPPTSGYTYCVELSADEAIAAGAAEIRFNQPVATYVENFLNFPVGSPVPTGYYDRQKGVWIAAPNGRVIEVLNTVGGLAALDTNGDALADDAPTLAALGVTDTERQQLAGLYAAGQTLWRVPVTHFTPWDHNWPIGPPEDAQSPGENGTEVTNNETSEEDGCEAVGSIIECENQVLGFRLPVVGTPYTLNYRSNRVPGRNSARALRIRLSGGFVPPSLKRIEVQVSVAGRWFQQIFPAEPDQVTFFEWDGLDAYGRRPQGTQRASVQIGFVYDGNYRIPGPAGPAFGQTGGAVITGSRARQEITVWSAYSATIGALDTRTLGLAGWTISAHHLYDPATRDLYLGDGTQRSVDSLARVVDIVAGVGSGFDGDGGPARDALFSSPQGLAFGPDGSLYIADTGNFRVRRVDPDGIITTFAGTGVEGFAGDGGPATQASFGFIRKVAVGPDGGVYIGSDPSGTAGTGCRVRRVGRDGVIHLVAGTSSTGFSGDGGPATLASLNGIRDLAVAPDGTLYISTGGLRVRRVGTDGVITTVVGGDTQGFAGDGGLASLALFGVLDSIAVGLDGALYISDFGNRRVRRVGTDGIVNTVAGNGGFVLGPDGILATDTEVTPGRITVGSDGVLYLFDGHLQGRRIRRVDLDGIITTVVGKTDTTPGFGANGIPAGQVLMGMQVHGIAVGPDGNLYYLDSVQVRQVAPPFSGISAGEGVVASEDGAELYVFSAVGRHLRTLHGLTGAVSMEFGFDNEGRLAQITEKTGGIDNVTTIQRDTEGNPTAIVAPHGQRTTLTVDSEGFLARVANPAGEAVELGSTPAGLVTAYTDPRGYTSTYAFEPDGRLIRNTDPVGGGQELALAFTETGYAVTRSTVLERTTIYEVEELPNRTQRRTLTAPDGGQTVRTEQRDAGRETVDFADGSVLTEAVGPDPRFGMASPVTTLSTLELPGATTIQTAQARNAVLANPADPLSLVTLTNRSVIAGRTNTSVYTATTRGITVTSPAGRVSTRTLDVLGRIVAEQINGLAPAAASYDTRGRLEAVTYGSGVGARTFQVTYTAGGFPGTITDPIGRTLQFGYDEAGRATTLTLPGARHVSLTFDAAGNPASVVPPGRTAHSFAHSPRNQLASITPPTVPGSAPTILAYDLDRAFTRRELAGNRAVQMDYDSAGRRLARVQTTDDLAVSTDTFSYDAAGRISGVTKDNGVQLTLTYDGPHLVGESWTGPVNGTVTRTYDDSLRLTSRSINGGATIALAYDADDLLVGAGSLTLTRHPQNGLVTGTTLGAVQSTSGHNEFGELTNRVFSVSGIPIHSLSLTRDALGRITQKTEQLAGVTEAFSYTYDVAGRLTNVMHNGLAAEAYAYDGNGNRINATAQGVGSVASHDAQDRLLAQGAATFAYDGTGTRLTRSAGGQATQSEYDHLGNLLGVTLPNGTTVTYLIDSVGRRIGRRVNGNLVSGYLFADTLHPVAELDATGALVSRFVYAGLSTPAYMIKGGVTYRIVADVNGSVHLVVNAATGDIVQRLDYDAFGRVTLDTNPGFQPFGFGGGLYDPLTGLVRMGVRDYDAETGRWTAQDPSGFAAGDFNLYAYAGNDPVNFNDPTGRDQEQCNELDQSRRLGREQFELILEERIRYLESFDDVVTREVVPEVSWLEALYHDFSNWLHGGPEARVRLWHESIGRGANVGGPRG